MVKQNELSLRASFLRVVYAPQRANLPAGEEIAAVALFMIINLSVRTAPSQ